MSNRKKTKQARANGPRRTGTAQRDRTATKKETGEHRATDVSKHPTTQPRNKPDDPGSGDKKSDSTHSARPLYPRTDAGNAELFAHVYREKLRYDHKRGRWLVWKPKHWWALDETAIVIPLAKNVARLRREASVQIEGTDQRKAEVKWAFQSEARSKQEAMLELAKSEHPLADRGDAWDENPWLLGVANGVVDLRTGQFREGKQSDKVTIHTNIAYDPTATAPRWEQFLDEIFGGDKEFIDFMQRAIGYSITGDVSEQVVFLCYGTGANGKSTFLDVLAYVLGAYAYNLPFSAFELKSRNSIPNEIAALEGKRFVTAVETNESVELNEARIKALTGSDPITARYLYHEFFTFVPTAKFWLAFNHYPEIRDDSDGFWRRIRVVEFRRQFSMDKRDRKLGEKLKAEAAGILNWVIEGALQWQKNGLNTPSSVEAASQAYRQESDALRGFIEDQCEVDPGASTAAGMLWEEYLRWTRNQDTDTLDRKSFSRRLKSQGFRKVRDGHDRTWTWLGIRLKRAQDEEFTALGPQASAHLEDSVASPALS